MVHLRNIHEQNLIKGLSIEFGWTKKFMIDGEVIRHYHHYYH